MSDLPSVKLIRLWATLSVTPPPPTCKNLTHCGIGFSPPQQYRVGYRCVVYKLFSSRFHTPAWQDKYMYLIFLDDSNWNIIRSFYAYVFSDSLPEFREPLRMIYLPCIQQYFGGGVGVNIIKVDKKYKFCHFSLNLPSLKSTYVYMYIANNDQSNSVPLEVV